MALLFSSGIDSAVARLSMFLSLNLLFSVEAICSVEEPQPIARGGLPRKHASRNFASIWTVWVVRDVMFYYFCGNPGNIESVTAHLSPPSGLGRGYYQVLVFPAYLPKSSLCQLVISTLQF